MKTDRRCVVCRVDISRDAGRCTNGCCSACHANFCTGGGDTTPGHHLNIADAKRRLAAYCRGDITAKEVVR